MNSKITLKKRLDFLFFGWLVNLAYPQYYRSKYNYTSYFRLFYYYVIPQKIFRLNGKVNWPVHFTSIIVGSKNIKKGILCDPGDSPNVYIQANNGINIGSNVEFAPGVKIISANHASHNFSEHEKAEPITIGNNVLIGANSIVLPSVTIGNNVVIGAGSVVSKNIPSNSIAVGNPCSVIKEKSAYTEDLSKVLFNRKIPTIYDSFLYRKD